MFSSKLTPMAWLLILTALTLSRTANAAPRVVVTLKPVHALVAAVMDGVAEPELLMQTSASPHHYSLKPSQRRALAQAELIVWVGPTLESFIPRVLSSLDPKIPDLTLMDIKDLMRLPQRQVEGRAHSAHGASTNFDPHIWLSTQNAQHMVEAIADQLSTIDPEHSNHYQHNRNVLHQRIDALQQQLTHQLKQHKHAYLSYHDAYQYFEHEFELKPAGFVTLDDETPPSAYRVKMIRDHLIQQQIRCVIYNAPTRPRIIDTIIANTVARAIQLDPNGVLLKPGKDTWFEIMTALAAGFNDCATAE